MKYKIMLHFNVCTFCNYQIMKSSISITADGYHFFDVTTFSIIFSGYFEVSCFIVLLMLFHISLCLEHWNLVLLLDFAPVG